MNRQAATEKGLIRRMRDLGLAQVAEPRLARKVHHSIDAILTALVAALVTMARSLRAVEQRTGEITAKHGTWLGLCGRIADNTFGRLLPRLRLTALLACLHRLVKAEHRRGNLKPTALPRGTVSIDGKNAATVHWPDLCRLLELEAHQATAAQVRALCAERFPETQVCVSSTGEIYALMRMHTVTLVSAQAAVCLHLRPIPGHTNEIGAMPELLDEVHAVYQRTRLFQWVTTDAGNTSLGVAKKIVGLGLQYFSQIQVTHGELYREAERVLGARRPSRAPESYADKQHGKAVTYYAWRHDLTEQGYLDWTHARQLVLPEAGRRGAGHRRNDQHR
jgi:hypothetical protein